jgi:hypothetical protein
MCDRSALALEAKARRIAKRNGYSAHKSRWRSDSIDNFGDFMLVDAETNCVVAGSRFDISAEEVLELFEPEQSK